MARSRDARQGHLFGDDAPAPTDSPGGVGPAAPREEHATLAARLPQELRMGSSSWAFPGWKGLVYRDAHPASLLAKEGLAAYARHPLLRSVGLDRTYYAPLAAADFAALGRAVPAGFRFLVKAPQLYTRPATPPVRGSGSRRWDANPRYLDAEHAARAIVEPLVEGLGEKAGPLVFQFSPLPRWRRQEPSAFASRLRAFLLALPRGPLYAVEIRNAELLGPGYAEALHAAGAAHCFNVHPTMPPIERQVASLGDDSGPATVVRWMLGHGQPYEDAKSRYAPFDRLVDPDPASRSAIAALCAGAARAKRPAYVIVNNKAEGSAPASVFELAALLGTALGNGHDAASPRERIDRGQAT